MIDLTGKRFGRLIVKSRQLQNKHNKFMWKCVCECGKTIYPTTGDLRSGNTRSCGCLAADRAREANTTHGLSYTKEFIRHKNKKSYSRRKQVDVEWTFDMEQLLRNNFNSCAMCGISNEDNLKLYGEQLHLDHIFPVKFGYGLKYDNVCLLCSSCNPSKHTKLLDELPIKDAIHIIKMSVEFQLLWESNSCSKT